MKKLYYIILLPIALHANTVIWDGLLPDNITYTNTNVNITGDTTLGQGVTTVYASDNDVTIYVSHKSKVYSNDNSQSTLILQANFPYTITIIMVESLEFSGVLNSLSLPIIIEERGTGTIEWIVEEGKHLIFGSGDHRGGTHLKVVYDNGIMPKHLFKPRTHHEQIKFERHCTLGYKEINASGPNVTYYAPINAINSDDEHYTYIQFADGASIRYERAIPTP